LQMVDEFVASRPAVAKELAILQLTRFLPDEAVVFPNKESLYRQEEKKGGRVLYFNYKRIAVAAAILLAVSTTAVLLMNNKKTNDGAELAVQEGSTKKSSTVAPKENVTPKENIPSQEILTPAENKLQEEQLASTDQKVNASAPGIQKKERTLPKQEEEVAVAPEKKQKNELPTPQNSLYAKNDIELDQLANVRTPVAEPLTSNKQITRLNSVTPDTDHSLDNIIAVNQVEPSDETLDQSVNEPGRKNKLRGFFRKITRTFEKTTNIKATDDDRLLVGGLAIRL